MKNRRKTEYDSLSTTYIAPFKIPGKNEELKTRNLKIYFPNPAKSNFTQENIQRILKYVLGLRVKYTISKLPLNEVEEYICYI